MSDGARLAATYYLPDGAPPGPGWPSVCMLHGLGENRNDETNALGMSINTLAETQLAPQGYAVLTFDARGHGQSEGLVGVDGPREIQDVRELFAWLTSQPAIHPGAHRRLRLLVRRRRDLARGGRRRSVRGDRGRHDLDRPLLRARCPRTSPARESCSASGTRSRRGPRRRSSPIVNDALAGRNLAAVRAFAAARSTRQLLGQIKAPTFLLQGRRDFAFDLEQALVPFARLKAPKRLYLGDFGHAPLALPAGELEHVLPDARRWFDRYLKGLPNGIDNEPRVEVAPDPWTGRTYSYRSLPARKTLRLTFRGRREIGSTGKFVRTLPRRKARLETFGAPTLRVALASPNGWPHVVAVLSAVTPQGREIVSAPAAPESGSARSRSRSRSG